MNPLTSSLVPPEPRTNPQRVRRSLGDGTEKESERDERKTRFNGPRERERKRESERREGNVARAESPVQTLSRAFSIMQIESDWLRSGFSTALLSFRAPEFSPRYASASSALRSPFPTPPRSLLSFLRVFARPCSTSETNGRRATAKALSGQPAAQLPVAGLFARPHGIIEKFRWPFRFADIHSQINARRGSGGGVGGGEA